MTIARFLDRVAAIWAKPSAAWSDVCAVALILSIGAATAAVGAVHTRIFGHDIFIFFDAGWRVLNGQRPEIDFNPSMGPLLSLLAAAGLKLAHNSPAGMGTMSALVGVIAGGWGYALTRRRMAAVPSTLAASVLALIAAAPFPIGWPPNTLSHAMLYNRYGYALAGLVALECFRPGEWNFAGGVSTGILSAALLFLKPSYCLVALGFAVCSLALQRGPARRAVGMAIGLAAVSLAMLVYLRFDFQGFRGDLFMLSAARSSGLSSWDFRWALFKGLRDFLPLGLLALLATGITATARPLVVTALFWIGGALLLATNAQPSGYPLNALLALILVEQSRATITSSTMPRFPKPEAILVLLGLICYAPVAIGDAAGVAFAMIESRKTPPPPVARFHGPLLSSLIFYDVDGGTDSDARSNGRSYVNYVNDGMELIQRFSLPTETVFTLDMVNPFPYALQRRPARGGTPALAFNHTFNDRHKPSAEWLFGFSDIVMVPKYPASAELDAQALFRNYLPAIESQFRLCAESDWWRLYKRR